MMYRVITLSAIVLCSPFIVVGFLYATCVRCILLGERLFDDLLEKAR